MSKEKEKTETPLSDNGAASAEHINVVTEARNTLAKEKINSIEGCQAGAKKVLEDTSQNIEAVIESDRGTFRGQGGFIAENLETGIVNAKSIANGGGERAVLLDNNGRDDLLIDSTPVQMKFVEKYDSLDAILKHLKMYPDAASDGVIYMIPKDKYEHLMSLWSLPEEKAKTLRKPDYTTWLKLQAIIKDNNLSIERIQAAEFNYASSKKNTYQQTLNQCEKEINEQAEQKILEVEKHNKPTWKEAKPEILAGAFVEGILQSGFVAIEKRKKGIVITEYSRNDVLEVTSAFAKGAVIGGMRSGFVYLVSSYGGLSGGLASAVFSFGEQTIELVIKKKQDKITKKEFEKGMTASAFKVAGTSAGAYLGAQAWKAHPVAGSAIGSVITMAGITLIKYSMNSIPQIEFEPDSERLRRREEMEKKIQSLQETIDWMNETIDKIEEQNSAKENE